MKGTTLAMTVVAVAAAAFIATPSYATHTMTMGGIEYFEGVANGIPVVSGGVGLDERAAMKDIQKNYDLKLEFAMKNREYVSDVKVAIQDANGKPVLDDVTHGPWFFAKLPAGEYKVMVSYAGRTETGDFKVGNGLVTRVFYW